MGKVRDLGVGNSYAARQFVRQTPQARAKNYSNFGLVRAGCANGRYRFHCLVIKHKTTPHVDNDTNSLPSEQICLPTPSLTRARGPRCRECCVKQERGACFTQYSLPFARLSHMTARARTRPESWLFTRCCTRQAIIDLCGRNMSMAQ